MKTMRLFALLLALVMILASFAACSPKEEDPTEPPATEPETEAPVTYADFLNANYSTAAETVAAMTAIPELNGYDIYYNGYESFYNDEVILLVKEDYTDPLNVKTNYKLFSFLTGKVVLTLTESNDVDYTFTFNFSTSTLKATKVATVYTNDVPTGTKTTYHLYDATGVEVINQTTPIGTVKTLHDWVVCDNVAYTVNEETGALTKKGMLPPNLYTFDSMYTTRTDNYIYMDADSQGVAVFDYGFNMVALWAKPTGANSYKFFVLDDGNLLIQYRKQLDPDTADYDYYTFSPIGNVLKYDLVTEIFSVTEKTSKAVNLNYVVSDCLANSRVNEDGEYTDTFDNIITVHPIINKRESTSVAELDFFYFGNDGTVGKSVKLNPYQTELPYKFTDGVYVVESVFGHALVDANGTVIAQMTEDEADQVGAYWLTDYGIYDVSFNLIYDFKEKNAELIDVIGDTIFVKQYVSADNKTDYSVLSFCNGTSTELCKYVATDANHTFFAAHDNLDICYLYNTETNEYKYYNAIGTLLSTNSVHLEYSVGDLAYGYSNGELVYYFVK